MKLDRRIVAGAAFFMALSLTQCKDTITAPEVALENLAAPVTTATVKAVEGVTFTFAGGGGALAPALAGQTFSLKFTNTAAASPTATFVLPSGTYTATTTFGSCIFTFAQAIPNVANPLTVNPCSLNVATAGTSTGTSGTANASVQLGGATSAGTPVSVSVGNDGTVNVGGVPVGNVNTGAATGSTN